LLKNNLVGFIRCHNSDTRIEAVNHARVDMPGANINPGVCRYIVPVPLPDNVPEFDVRTEADGLVQLSWERSPE
jgi:hypothetical protein